MGWEEVRAALHLAVPGAEVVEFSHADTVGMESQVGSPDPCSRDSRG